MNMEALPERMKHMKKSREPLVVAICGIKNSGKTTCMEQLIALLSTRGYKVAAIKHDGHDFQADVPGTDSYRMQQAGAYGTAVFSENRLLVYKETKTGIDSLIQAFPESDLILVEGMKDTELLKLEIVRQGISDEPVSNPTGRLGILTDVPKLLNAAGEAERNEANVGVLDLNELDKVAEYLAEMIKER